MKIHSRLAGGLISFLLVLIIILIDKIFDTKICSNKIIILIICIAGGVVTYIVAKRDE